MTDTQEPKDDKKVEVVEGKPTVKPVDDGKDQVREKTAAEVLAEAEKGSEEEKVGEALKKRFLLLAEDDPRLRGLLDEFKSAGGEQMAWAHTLEGVKKETDDFIRRVEKGELDQTILTMIADLEYPQVEDDGPDPQAGLEGVNYVREAVAKYNLAHPDKPLQVEIILNSTVAARFQDEVGAEAISTVKKDAVKTLLELIKK